MAQGEENSLSLGYEERLYESFLRDPASIPEEWRAHFDGLGSAPAAARLGPQFKPGTLFRDEGRNGHGARAVRSQPDGGAGVDAALQQRVDHLIRNYRARGHLAARLDPLGNERPSPPELTLASCGLSEVDLGGSFATPWNDALATLHRIVEHLKETYCRAIGVEFMHIDDPVIRQWLQRQMEESQNKATLSTHQQSHILDRLTDAIIWEQFVQRKYVGAKRFSLEGAETLIPLLDMAIENAGGRGIAEIVLAMAHRGRLNVLTNIVDKPAVDIFRELEDAPSGAGRQRGGGDVMYHLGYSTDWRTPGNPGTTGTTEHAPGTPAKPTTVHVSLCFNPSHLEFINPVAQGRLRAKQDRVGDQRGDRGLAILIHGDASFAGEGIIQESLNLSQLAAYATGGSLHVIVNNQIGFVTTPEEGRSTPYASDAAKLLQVPIFHVNGDDPDAVAWVVRLAMDFRDRFRRDVVIDMYCYRRRGHSEGDEPAFTQPLLYDAIARHPTVRDAYLERLLAAGVMSKDQAQEMIRRKTEALEAALQQASQPAETNRAGAREPRGVWRGFRGGRDTGPVGVTTAIPLEQAAALLEATARLPGDFHPHRKLERWLAARREMAAGQRPLDWAAGEALAFASLAAQGYRVRMSGQDARRGTFSQRHAVLYDVQDGHTFCPLARVADGQAPVEIFNSPLSEAGVMGFEYGYSLDWPDGLILWEAQYGDFANAAQVIIDQFIASAEKKWNRLSGLVLLLPHGFEGHGPEHSSARMERWLTLAADHNFRVVCPTTPAQCFHLLRRQALWPVRKPLIVFTPKGLLREPLAASPREDCAQGSFRPVLGDESVPGAGAVRLVLLCSGRVYYDLHRRREQLKRTDVAIVRLEQLYPLPAEELSAAIKAYPREALARWVQEEPQTRAWRYLRAEFGPDCRLDGLAISPVTRPESASPAAGSSATHRLEQKELVARAFADVKSEARVDDSGGRT